MAVTSVGTGSQVIAALDTEYTLDTETNAGVYVLVVDCNVLANGDTIVIRIYTKYASGGTSRVAYQQSFSNVQVEMNKYSPAVPVDEEIVCKIEQTDGTERTFPWNLLKIS